MSDLLTDDDLKTERATEPPKRWRNWWRFDQALPCFHCDRTVGPGADYTCSVFPSKDAAGTCAMEVIAVNGRTDSWPYIGAFPDGEAPVTLGDNNRLSAHLLRGPRSAPRAPRARKTHCKRGHPRTPENLTNGGACRLCAKSYKRGS